MKKLRCLRVHYKKYNFSYDCVKIDEARQYFPNSLRYICWSGYPHWCLPKTFEADNLVALEMPNSEIKQLWEGGKVMKKLKFLDLSYTKVRSLDLVLTPNLERLDLDCCGDLVKLYVHSGCLKSLVYLNLSFCTGLKSISFIEQLESLAILYTSGLNLRTFPDYIIRGHFNNSLLELHLSQNDIEEVPSSIGNLRMLVSLYLVLCYKLKSLPGSICSLRHLRTLNLNFAGIEELPEDLGQLECLENLCLTSTHVKHLPSSICMLKRLKTLLLSECNFLEKLPEDVDQLESLEILDLQLCRSLREIPNNICKLKYLKEFELQGCRRLEKLPDELGNLKCLQLLDVRDTSITHFPQSISLLKGLKIHESELKDQIVDDDFIQLCSRYDSENRQIQGFQHLKTLDLGRCGIEELHESLGQLTCIKELDLSYTDFKHLPDSICKLKHLEKLILQRCVHLEKLPDNVGHLESLEVLDLSRCYSIREIPNSICMLKRLKILVFYHCFCLEKLPEDVGKLESLEELHTTRCYDIREIPKSICLLKHLKKLHLEGCRRLEKLPDELGELDCLKSFDSYYTQKPGPFLVPDFQSKFP